MDSVGDYHLSLTSKQNANLHIDTNTCTHAGAYIMYVHIYMLHINLNVCVYIYNLKVYSHMFINILQNCTS